jgi:hypothetical protein
MGCCVSKKRYDQKLETIRQLEKLNCDYMLNNLKMMSEMISYAKRVKQLEESVLIYERVKKLETLVKH